MLQTWDAMWSKHSLMSIYQLRWLGQPWRRSDKKFQNYLPYFTLKVFIFKSGFVIWHGASEPLDFIHHWTYGVAALRVSRTKCPNKLRLWWRLLSSQPAQGVPSQLGSQDTAKASENPFFIASPEYQGKNGPKGPKMDIKKALAWTKGHLFWKNKCRWTLNHIMKLFGPWPQNISLWPTMTHPWPTMTHLFL